MNEDDVRRAGFVPVGVADDEDISIARIDPPQVAVFHGRPKLYYLAVCDECNEGRRPIPMPFNTEEDRDWWADGHRTTGHTVHEALEVRP